MLAPTLWENCGYVPHDGQIPYHESMARFKVPACGRRFGKSEMAAAEGTVEMFDKDRPGRGWIVAPTYETADEFQYMWDFIVINMGLGSKLKKANNARTGEMYIEMPWGSRVEVKSADKPASLVGKGLKWCILSEAAKLHTIIFRKYIRPALADFHGWCSMPSTPEGFNWYKELHDRGSNPNFPDWASWNLPAWLNPYVYPGGFDDPEVQNQMLSPDDPWFWQEIGGKFQSVVGLIYSNWNRDIHVKAIPYNPAWQNQLWFDFGYSNPTVALDVMIDPSDNVYVWREYYIKQKPAHIHAKELRDRPSPKGYHLDWASGDAADPEAVETYGSMLCPMIAMPETKDVNRGILEVNKFLKTPHGDARLFVDPSCVNTIHEFETYKMKEPRHAMAMENPKEEPRKYDDHALDAIRYGIMHNFVLGGNAHLSEVSGLNQDITEDSGIFTWGEHDSITMGAGSW